MTRVLSLVLMALQDEAQIRDWIGKLQDDSIEVREESQQRLIDFGRPALPFLDELERGADEELRCRVSWIRTQIDRRSRLEAVLRGPSLITLKTEVGSVREALAELARQGKVEIDFDDVPSDLRVTYACENAGFWESLDGLCRSHGGLSWSVGKKLTVKPEGYADAPKKIQRQFLVRLREVVCRQEIGPGPNGPVQTVAELEIAWEPGNRPIAVEFEIPEEESDYSAFPKADDLGVTIFVGLSRSTTGDRLPGLKGILRLNFPVEFTYLQFPVSGGSPERLNATLRKLERNRTTVSCQLDVLGNSRELTLNRGPLELGVEEDKWIPMDHFRTESGDGYERRYFVAYVSETTVLRELRYQMPKEIHSELIPIDFPAVSLK